MFALTLTSYLIEVQDSIFIIDIKSKNPECITHSSRKAFPAMAEEVSFIKNQFEQSQYTDLCPIGDSGNVLVLNQLTGRIGLKKVLSYYSVPVFGYLRSRRNIHIPMVYACWEENGKLTVIEEYIQGETLEEFLRKASSEKGTGREHDKKEAQSCDPPAFDQLSHDGSSHDLTRKKRLQILLDICDGVRFLHGAAPAPIIHRDLKPSNIMITDDGVVKIIDYDAAKIYQAAEDRDTVLLGTEGSAAPEQYGFGSSDVRTDVYGIGMLIRELFPDDPQMQKIADKATRMDPKDRYPDVRAVQQALSGKPSADSRVPGILRFIPGFRSGKPRNRLIATLGYILLLYFTLSTDFQDGSGEILTGAALWINRICFLLAGLSVIFLFTGAFSWMLRLPLLQKQNRVLRLLGYLLWAVIFIVFWVAVSTFL